MSHANDGRKSASKPAVAIASRLFIRLRSRWVVQVVPLASHIRTPFFVIRLPCDGLESSGPRIPIAFCQGDRKSTRLNSSHLGISYAVVCVKKKKRVARNERTEHT